MSSNGLLAAFRAGGSAVGGWCATPSALNAEILAAEGFDYVGIDCQHGLVGYSNLVPMLSALSGWGATPVVRVATNDDATIGKALDAGAEVVIVPMVNTVDEADAAVRACRYPPRGRRSFGPVRAGMFLNASAPDVVDEEVLCLVMIETVDALERAEKIAAVEGVDGIYVGPADLALSMGHPPAMSGVSKAHDDAVAHLKDVCVTRSIIPAIHTGSGEVANAALSAGFRMVTVSSDVGFLRAAGRAHLAAARANGPNP